MTGKVYGYLESEAGSSDVTNVVTTKVGVSPVGDGTKVVFTGDTSQIDAPYLGESNNALAVLTRAFSGQRCFGHITLTRSERSPIAALVTELLEG